ncbi:PsaF/MyfF family fimbrial adhesin regulatory protein [Escherichia coli]|nr:protein psaF [Escherichia coli]
MKKKLIILSILFLVIVLPIYSLNDNVKLYSDRKFDSIEEHTDLNINGMKFNILHYIATCDNSNLIVSETISGVALKTSANGYYLIPTHQYTTSKNGSFEFMGNIYSMCVYHIKNKNNNVVVFFDENRSVLSFNKKIIRLPTVFLGEEKHITHQS